MRPLYERLAHEGYETWFAITSVVSCEHSSFTFLNHIPHVESFHFNQLMSSRWRIQLKVIIVATVISSCLLGTYFFPHLFGLAKAVDHPFGSSKHGDTTLLEELAPTSILLSTAQPERTDVAAPIQDDAPSQPTEEVEVDPGPRIKYKNDTMRPLAARPFVRINETFPAAAKARSPADLPRIPSWNAPPKTHVKEVTPIFVGFTRNWFLLQQTVVALITAGWPPSDIYVVENTGVMNANVKGQLSDQNPFYLDHHRLTEIFGVNVLVTPSLQTFAQLQNYYLYHAITNKWPHYFWAHMDIMIQSSEDKTPYLSFYQKAVNALRQAKGRWGLKYFAYDWVTLMNTKAMEELGGWDSMISYYTIDCDMYDRMRMLNYSTGADDCGPVYDTGESLPNLQVLYREGDVLNSTIFHEMQHDFETMTHVKNNGDIGPRNRWQVAQMGGQGEPYYRDLDGFAEALEYQVDAGIKTYEAKWHAGSCALRDAGLKPEDEWKVESVDGH